VLFLFSYVILVIWIFFQVSVAVLLENYLAARCWCLCPVTQQAFSAYFLVS
jgi:hypothetical protein